MANFYSARQTQSLQRLNGKCRWHTEEPSPRVISGGTQKNRPPVLLFPCSSPVLLEFDGSKLVFPVIEPTSKDVFLKRIESSKKRWIIFQDPKGNPRFV